MVSFKEYADDFASFEELLNEFNTTSGQVKPWSAKKADILQTWKMLRDDTPVMIQPIGDKPAGNQQSNFAEDGLRITGSWAFIASVLSRIKDIAAYENQNTKLRLSLRAVDKSHARPDRQSFVFYVNLEKRSKGKAGRPSA